MADIDPRLVAALADKYRLDRELGAGGMATVYLAHDLKHEREVAIKVLHPDLGAALGADRFLSEIKTTAKLNHPHILPLLDSGALGGFLFYVMPYVTGETLRDRLMRENQLSVADALRITREVADALAEAHGRGIVHRDIKPENILLQGAHAVVADFGIALAVQQASGPRMTQTGLSLGTPQYMSPEQAMGDKNVDHRADIYALGAVAYEMLTGEPPHMGTNPQAIVAKLLSEPVRPVNVLRPAVPLHVDAAIQVALQKLAADRFPSVAEFSEALRSDTGARASSALLTSALPATARGRRGFVAAVAGVGLAALGIGWLLGRERAPVAADLPALVVSLAGPLASEATIAGAGIVLSDDGTLLAVSAPDSVVTSHLVIRHLTSAREVELEGEAVGAAFSPDGRSLAYTVPGAQAIRVVSVEGGLPTTVAVATSGGIAWLDDSTLVLGGLRRVALGRSGIDTLPRAASDGPAFGFPSRLTADLILVSAGKSQDVAEVGIYSVTDGTFRSLGVRGTRAVFVYSGIVLYLDQGTVWGLEVDPRRFTPMGRPRAVVDGRTGSPVLSFDASPNGVLVVRRTSASAGRRLVIADRTGAARDVLPQRALYRSPRFSPEGDRIAYSTALRATFGGDIFVANIRDGATTRVTSDSMYLAPEWSSDGRRIVYASSRTGGADKSYLISVDAAGGGTVDTILGRANRIFEYAVTADGRRILWREDVAVNTRDILSAEPRSSVARPERATRFDERGIALSPDEQWYLYTSTETGRSEVYLSRLGGDGARWKVSPSGGTEPRWARNSEVFFRTIDSVYATRVTLGATPRVEPPRALFADDFYYVGYEAVWDVSADGKRFVFVAVDQTSRATIDLMVNWIKPWRANTR